MQISDTLDSTTNLHGNKSPRPLRAALDREPFMITDSVVFTIGWGYKSMYSNNVQTGERKHIQTNGQMLPNVLSPLLRGR